MLEQEFSDFVKVVGQSRILHACKSYIANLYFEEKYNLKRGMIFTIYAKLHTSRASTQSFDKSRYLEVGLEGARDVSLLLFQSEFSVYTIYTFHSNVEHTAAVAQWARAFASQ